MKIRGAKKGARRPLPEGPFTEDAYLFVLGTVQEICVGAKGQHVSPADVLSALADHAVDHFGLCGRGVLAAWGVGLRTGEDVGMIVRDLVAVDLLEARPGETHADRWAEIDPRPFFAAAELELLDAAATMFGRPIFSGRPPRRRYPNDWKSAA